MDHFVYKDGVLHAEDVAVSAIAEAVGTPFYCYSTATLVRHFNVFQDSLSGLDPLICYAVKANGNVAVISTLAAMGAGADVVSLGEMKRALAAGVPADRIVFSGVGKSRAEMAEALKAGIFQINLESEPEMDVLSEVAQSLGVRARCAIRVNPDVDAQTHAKISTGKSENKFGIEWTRAHEVYNRMANTPGIQARGLAVHIGSQLTNLEPFRNAFHRLRDLVSMLRADGHAVDTLDLGGGLGVSYDNMPVPAPDAYGRVVRETVGDLGCRLMFEPGRVIAGNAGVLVTRIIYVKKGATRTFAIVDAGMNDLARPAMYDAHHDIVPVNEPEIDAETSPMDVVGPICETGDTFCVERRLPPLAAEDLLVFRTAGAYGASMASTYNTRALIPEVLVKGREFAVVRPRLDIDTMIAQEEVPDWLKSGAAKD